MEVYDLIYESYELEQNDCDEDALNYASGIVFSEIESHVEKPVDYNHIGTVDGVDVYHQYGADYYFFSPEFDD